MILDVSSPWRYHLSLSLPLKDRLMSNVLPGSASTNFKTTYLVLSLPFYTLCCSNVCCRGKFDQQLLLNLASNHHHQDMSRLDSQCPVARGWCFQYGIRRRHMLSRLLAFTSLPPPSCSHIEWDFRGTKSRPSKRRQTATLDVLARQTDIYAAVSLEEPVWSKHKSPQYACSARL